MPKLEELEKLGQALKTIAEGSAGDRRTKSARILEKVRERDEKYREVKNWAKDITSEDEGRQERARKQARNEAKDDKYTNRNTPLELKSFKKDLQATITAGHTVPNWLRDVIDGDPKNIQTVAVARLVNKISLASQDQQNNPNFLLQERAKAYWGTPWDELTQAQTTHQRQVLNAVDNKIYEILATSRTLHAGAYDHILQYKPDDLWDIVDDTFNLYKTEKLPLEVDERGKKLTTKEKEQRLALDEELRNVQRVIDARLRPEKELEKLDTLVDMLSSGKGVRFRPDDVESTLERIHHRISELQREIKKAQPTPRVESASETSLDDFDDIFGREYAGAIRDGMRQRAEFSYDLRAFEDALANAITPGLPELAREILSGDNYKNLTSPDSAKLLNKLNDLERTAGVFDAAHGKIMEVMDRLSTLTPEAVAKLNFQPEEELQKLLAHDIGLFRFIREALNAKQYEFAVRAGKLPGRSYFIDHPDKKQLIDQLTKDDFLEGGRNNDNVYEVFWDILSKANIDPKREFHEVFDWLKEQDLTTLYDMLKQRGKEVGVDPNTTKELLGRLSGLYKINEVYHNCIMIAEGASGDAAEQITKYLTQFTDYQFSEMFEAVPGIQEAFDCQTREMYRVVADFKNRLDPETMKLAASYEGTEIIPKMGKPSVWQQRFLHRFQTMVDTGEFQDLKDMKPWQIEIANKFAFGFNIASGQFSQELTRITGAWGFRAGPYDVLKLDKFRGLILKFGVGKPGFAMLYYHLTGDIETAKDMAKNPGSWSVEKALKAFEMAETDPRFEDSMARRRNISQVTMNLGAPSKWALRAFTDGMDRTMYEHRGTAIKIGDVWSDVEKEYRDEISAILEKQNKKTTEENIVKELENRRDEIYGEVTKRIQTLLLREALETSPLEMTYLWSFDYAMQKTSLKSMIDGKLVDVRTDLLQKVLIKVYGQEYVNAILTGDSSVESFTIHSSDFRTREQVLADALAGRKYKKKVETDAPFTLTKLKEIFVANPKHHFDVISGLQHLSGTDLDKVLAANKRLMNAFDLVEGDLALVEARRKERVLRMYDEMKNKKRIGDINPKILPEDFTIIEKIVEKDTNIPDEEKAHVAASRKEAARLYFDGIKTESVLTRERGESGKSSFLTRYSKRIATGKESYVPYTTDIPLKYYNWAAAGGRGNSRRWIDASAVMKGQVGMVDVLNMVEAHPNFEHLARAIKEKVTIPISSYWDLVAQVNSGMLWSDIIYFYEQNKFHDYSGPVGLILRNRWISEKLYDWGLYRTPLMASNSKVLISADSESLSPSERMRNIDFAEGINILPKGVLPFGWGVGGEQFTAKALKKKHRALPKNVITEFAMWIPFVMPALMIIQGFKEAVEEQKS